MANPFQWASYQAPTLTQQAATAGNPGTHGFWTPSDTKLPTGAALGDYLGANGPAGYTNRAIKYASGLGLEALGNSTSFLDGQLKTGFETLNDAMQYGGNFGDRNSPVYSPMSQNGYGQGWGGSNPFKIGSF